MNPARPLLSARYADALQLACSLHACQPRKGTTIPYVSHLLAVSSIALEHGANEDEAIAALLHDAVEDAGGVPTLNLIRERYGAVLRREIADTVSNPAEIDGELAQLRAAAGW